MFFHRASWNPFWWIWVGYVLGSKWMMGVLCLYRFMAPKTNIQLPQKMGNLRSWMWFWRLVVATIVTLIASERRKRSQKALVETRRVTRWCQASDWGKDLKLNCLKPFWSPQRIEGCIEMKRKMCQTSSASKAAYLQHGTGCWNDGPRLSWLHNIIYTYIYILYSCEYIRHMWDVFKTVKISGF